VKQFAPKQRETETYALKLKTTGRHEKRRSKKIEKERKGLRVDQRRSALLIGGHLGDAKEQVRSLKQRRKMK